MPIKLPIDTIPRQLRFNLSGVLFLLDASSVQTCRNFAVDDITGRGREGARAYNERIARLVRMVV